MTVNAGSRKQKQVAKMNFCSPQFVTHDKNAMFRTPQRISLVCLDILYIFFLFASAIAFGSFVSLYCLNYPVQMLINIYHLII